MPARNDGRRCSAPARSPASATSSANSPATNAAPAAAGTPSRAACEGERGGGGEGGCRRHAPLMREPDRRPVVAGQGQVMDGNAEARSASPRFGRI